MKKLFSLLIICMSILVACEQEIDYELENKSTKEIKEFSEMKVEHNRLVFDSEESFGKFYNSSLDMSEEDYAKKIENNIYTKEFYSLMPITTEIDEGAQIEKHFTKLREKSKKCSIQKEG